VNEDSQTRAYLSNVCVAKELQKKGLGYALVDKSKKLAREWGKFISSSVVDPFYCYLLLYYYLVFLFFICDDLPLDFILGLLIPTCL
jgi:GNAT superfamily N-acetyltransferase